MMKFILELGLYKFLNLILGIIVIFSYTIIELPLFFFKCDHMTNKFMIAKIN